MICISLSANRPLLSPCAAPVGAITVSIELGQVQFILFLPAISDVYGKTQMECIKKPYGLCNERVHQS